MVRAIRCGVIFFIGCFIFASFSFAGTGLVSGYAKGSLPSSYIPNASVKLYNSANQLVGETTSNESGQFFFTNLEPGTFRIELECNGYYNTVNGITVENGKTSNGDIFAVPNPQMSTDTGGVGGRFFNGVTGEPVQGVSVAVWVSGAYYSYGAITGPGGYWNAPGVPPGNYMFLIDVPYGYYYYVETPPYVVVTPGYGTWFDYYTSPLIPDKCGLFGTILDQFGNPVSGATVTLANGTQTYQVQTNSNGVYGFGQVTPGSNYTLTSSKTGYVPLSSTVGDLSQHTAKNKHVTMNTQGEGKALTGAVTESTTGNPVNGATVTLNNGTETRTGTTGSDGKYTVTDLSPEKAWELLISKEGYHTTKKKGIESKETEVVTENQRIVPKTPGKGALIGKATYYPSGAPCPDSKVTIYNVNGEVANVTTNSAGEYSFEGLAPGTYWVKLADGTEDKNLVYECRATVVELLKPEGPLVGAGAILGGVTDDSTGKAVPGATVTVNNGETTKTATTDESGKYVVTGLSPDRAWEYVASLEGYHSTKKTGVEVKSGEITTENQRLVPKIEGKGAVTGKVTNTSTASPVAGARVVAMALRYDPLGNNEPEELGEATSDADGNYTIPGLNKYWSGSDKIEYRLMVYSDGLFETEILNFTIEEGHALVKNIPMSPSVNVNNGGINGRVIDTNTGKVTPGATVNITDGQTTRTVVTGSTGEYTVTELSPDRAWTEEVSKEGYHTTTKKFEVKPGELVVQDERLIPKMPGRGAAMGKVVDSRTGLPIAGATLTVIKVPLYGMTTDVATVTTDANGNYTVPGLFPDTYCINVARTSSSAGSGTGDSR